MNWTGMMWRDGNSHRAAAAWAVGAAWGRQCALDAIVDGKRDGLSATYQGVVPADERDKATYLDIVYRAARMAYENTLKGGV